MRDPERIDRICKELAEQWKKVPDWRFMQLINNFQRCKQNDCFYMEDEKFINDLIEMLRYVNY